MATVLLASRNDVKLYLGKQDTTALDQKIDALLQEASAAIPNYLNRAPLFAADFDDLYDGSGGTSVTLAHYPVREITAVSVDGVNIPPAANFQTSGWRLAGRQIVLRGYAFSRGSKNVEVTYSAGYDLPDAEEPQFPMPEDLRLACVQYCAIRLSEATRMGIAGRSLGREAVTYQPENYANGLKDGMPSAVRSILGSYVNRVPETG